jgi:hypothetical protein
MSLDTAAATAKLNGLTAKFDNTLAAMAPYYPNLCTVVTSKGADERYAMLGRVPAIREWIGDRSIKQMAAADWTVVNRPWEVTVGVDKFDIDDDRLGMYGPLLEQLAANAARHPDKLVWDLMVAGETGVCFDAQCFYDTDHVWGDSGSQSNDLTYAAADGTTPTATEFKLAYNAALKAMQTFKDNNGNLINGYVIDEATSILVVVPPDLLQVAHDALTVRTQSAGGENWVLSAPRILSCALLTDATKFYIHKVDEPLRPFIFQQRMPLKREMKGIDDLEFREVKFMTEARYEAAYGVWWTSVLTTFT